MTPNPSQRQNLLFFSAHYLLCLLLFLPFVLQTAITSTLLHGFWTALLFVSYPALYLLPGLFLSAIAFHFPRKALFACGFVIAILWTSLTEFLLVLDAVILSRFASHINGLVLNLMLTPGGFDAMGLDGATLTPAILLTALFLGLNSLWGHLCHRWDPLRRLAGRLFSRGARIVLVSSVLLACFATSLLLVGFADFYSVKNILISTNNYPVAFSMRMRKFLRKVGCQESDREESLFDQDTDDVHALDYPNQPIRRTPPALPYNVLWLTAESLRADLLSPEVMPHAWTLAQKSIHALRHYSGGHGTRPAMFSMFYGLYGGNWDSFLACRRAPLFFDWLHEDGYDFLVQTSAKFTYPEFDQTIFASVPTEKMFEQQSPEPWKRDIQATDKILELLNAWTPEKPPFFAFEFFEETHAPYTFDESQPLYPDYFKEINYATVSPKDGPMLYRRQQNAAHCMDMQIGRILQALDANPVLASRTIVVLNGDHGEEFYEKGHLGHNSTFAEEQLRPPLVIHIPGVPYTPIDHNSHHTDIIPTLAPYFGVENSPEDYCVGQSLLDPGYNRTSFIICGWKIDTYVDSDFKYILPIGAGSKFYGRNLFSAEDKPLDTEKEFLKTHSRELLQANRDMTRFVRRSE